MKRTILALLALSVVGAAHGVELIVNGGFESGITGWTSSTTNGTPADNAGNFGQPVNGGTSSAWLGGWGTVLEVASLSQVVSIPVNSVVTFSFFSLTGGGPTTPPTMIEARIGSIVVFSGSLGAVGGTGSTFTQFSVNASSLSGNQTVSFTYDHPAGAANSNWFFDDVSVQANPVPEPASILAIATGAAVLLRRRRVR